MFNTRFCPITAKPIKPISQFASAMLVPPYKPPEAWYQVECLREDGAEDQSAAGVAGSSSETNVPIGLVTVLTAIVPSCSPRRYMRYAAVTPAITVPQKKIFFAMAPPLRIHTLLGCTSGLMGSGVGRVPLHWFEAASRAYSSIG